MLNSSTIVPTHTSQQCLSSYPETKVSVAGRVVFFRNLGKVCFGKLVDQEGIVQFCLKAQDTPNYNDFKKQIKIGDIVYVAGEIWVSQTGEKTVLVTNNISVLCSSKHPFPNKVSGIVDTQTKLRKRYLDIITNSDTKDIFRARSKVIQTIRRSLENDGFMEVETPVLGPTASGAQARSFITHHNAYDTTMHLRIAPETYLKRVVGASFDKVFELGKNFRNEGIGTSHMQEFTSVEWYAAYWNYIDNLHFFQKLFSNILYRQLFDQTDYIVNHQGIDLDFNMFVEDISKVTRTYSDVFEEYVGVSPWEIESAKKIDETFKEKVRPNLIQPIVLIDYPAHMSPLAKRSDNGNTVEQWQFIVNGQELVKCYTELTDPTLQRSLLEDQMLLKNGGDYEAVELEEDFLLAMEYGFPPMSGLGMGIDRVVALLTNQTTLRDVVLFPSVF